MKTIALVVTLGVATPAVAQNTVTLRPYGMITYEQFAATTTFDAAFGQSGQPFWGAGAQLILTNGVYVDVSASRFSKEGQRAFVNNGQVFQLNIPVTASLTPFEVAVGYRFRLRRHPDLVPFAAGGFGWYSYKESSTFSVAGEDIDSSHAGLLVNGGVEFRVHRLIRLSLDAQYTHIPGVLGSGGVSQEVGESDLGGIAARFKFIVGR